VKPILVLGDINLDLVWGLPRFPHEGDDCPADSLTSAPGGTGLNAATTIAALGGRVRLIGRVGCDPASALVLSFAKEREIDCSLVQKDPELPTGLCSVAVHPSGQRTFFSHRGANPQLALTAALLDAVREASLLLLGGHALLTGPQRATALQLCATAVAAQVPVALDLALPTVRECPETLARLLPDLWLLTCNRDELAAWRPGQDAAHALRELVRQGVGQVALKLGADGCLVGRHAELLHQPPPPVAVVDTTGCGDAFAAAFAWALRRGATLAAAAALANTLGALTATAWGGAAAVPTRARLAQIVPRELLALGEPARP